MAVTFTPGGAPDTLARILAEDWQKTLGIPIVVENRPGHGGNIGADLVAKSNPDGYTLLIGTVGIHAINGALYDKLPYDPIADFTPISFLASTPNVLIVSKQLGVQSPKDLIALAKAKPNELTFGSSGIGGAHHLSGEMFRNLANIDIVHVPYKGGAPAATDLMAGHLSMMFEMGYAALPAIKGQKIHPLAVTSTKRLALLPDVPTMVELGIPNFESYNWQGIIAPGGTPAAIISKLNAVLNEILLDPEVVKQISDAASQVGGGTPEAFAQFIASETAKWAKVIKSANIQPQ
jgi:tripartite-type tricarboxylate transporter receptor subunit TctC